MHASSTVAKLSLAGMLVLVLGACGYMPFIPWSYEAEAFGKSKKFAVVTVAASPEIGVTVNGIAKTAPPDSDYRKDTSRILRETTPLILKELERSPYYTLVSPRTVLANKAYRTTASDDPTSAMLSSLLLTAPGYKFFGSEDRLAQLARDLKVDAVMVVSVDYASGFTAAGSGGVQRGRAVVSVNAVNQAGIVIWKDGGAGVSDNFIRSTNEAVNHDKLRPLLIEASRNAARKLLDKVESKFASL